MAQPTVGFNVAGDAVITIPVAGLPAATPIVYDWPVTASAANALAVPPVAVGDVFANAAALPAGSTFTVGGDVVTVPGPVTVAVQADWDIAAPAWDPMANIAARLQPAITGLPAGVNPVVTFVDENTVTVTIPWTAAMANVTVSWNGAVQAQWETATAGMLSPWTTVAANQSFTATFGAQAGDGDGAATLTGVIPTNWRLYRLNPDMMLDGTGEIYLSHMLGDENNDEIVFVPAYFQWQVRNAQGRWDVADPGTLAGVSMTNPAAMRAVHFNNSDARLVTSRTSANWSARIRDVALHSNTSRTCIRVRTPIYMTATGNADVTFDVSIRLVNRNFIIGRVVVPTGNDRVYVFNDNEWVSPTNQEYLRTTETLRNVEIYAGEGVTFFRNMTANVSIYVQAALWTDYAADALFQQHAELVDIIDIHHSGFNAAGVRAEIDRDNVYFVYDAQRRFIGTTDDTNLPFSTRYYLTTAQINLGNGAAEDNGDDAPAEEPGDDPVLGGDAGAGSSNVNHNPGTGR